MMRILIALLFLLTACSDARNTTPPQKSFTDDLDRAVSLPADIERVVTLAPSVTEVVFAAGAGHKLAGVGLPDDYPPAVDTLPRYSTYPINFEAIAALRPDVVLATDQVNSPRDAETFQALDIPTVFFSYERLDDVLRGIRTTGALLGTSERADKAADSLEQVIETLREQTAELSERPRVLFLIGDETLYAFGRDSYIHDLIALAGGRSVTADVEAKAPVLSEEFVLRERPDVIIGPWGRDYDRARLLELHPSWDVIPAIRDGRVYSIDPGIVLRPGPRLVHAARQMAALLHPGIDVRDDASR